MTWNKVLHRGLLFHFLIVKLYFCCRK